MWITMQEISVVIPVYNQYNSLLKTLNGFRHQFDIDFELIIIDDGSTDLTKTLSDTDLNGLCLYRSKIIHQKNGGRAAARNHGVEVCDTEYILFNDCDRIPSPFLIQKYKSINKNINNIYIGEPYDYFGINEADIINLNWENIIKYSRLSSYYHRVVEVCDGKNKIIYPNPWLSFLVGNSCLSKYSIQSCGGFNESFRDWGFEHFELAYRLYINGSIFIALKECANYHIPHRRTKNFYKEKILYNIELITSLHKGIERKDMLDAFRLPDSKEDHKNGEQD